MKKRKSDFIMYLLFVFLILMSPFWMLNSGKKKAVKYYQIIECFQKEKVVGYELKLGSGDISLVVQEVPVQTQTECLVSIDALFNPEDPNGSIDRSKELMRSFYSSSVTGIYYDLEAKNFKLEKISRPAVLKKINYRLPNVELFLFDTRDYVKSYNLKNPDSIMKIDYKRASSSSGMMVSVLLNSILPMILLGVGWFFIIRYMSKGPGSQEFGGFKSKAIKYLDKGPKVTFDDVAALKEEKEEVRDLIEFLRDPNKFDEIGARIPAGVLLVGPPGTGKTLLAKALAGEANVPFYFISGSAFVEMFVGVGASRVRDLFAQAKKNAPGIIFIDEIDAVGKKRDGGSFGGHDERDQTLNQLLVEMDGFKSNSGVIVIAATNMSDTLDRALLRPGRFDRQVYIGYPDVLGREEILKVHARNKAIAPDVNFETVAKATIGFTGADLAGLMNEAALLAVKNGKKSVRAQDIDAATIKVIVGTEKKSKVVTPENRKSTAYHEAGHAVCAYYCENYDDVNMVSIIPTGHAGGFTLSMPKEDDMYVTDKAMFERVVVSMGGRAAEKLILDEISSGASEDMKSATLNARRMVTIYGFTDELGSVVYDNAALGISSYMDPLSHSEEVRAKIDSQIKKIVDNAYAKAFQILTERKGKLEELANYLISHEKIDSEGFKSMMETGV